MEPETLHIAKDLICAVLARAPRMHIILYHSKSYDSVYIKFDVGVANSCRVADHDSKKSHLSYRFNILLNTSRITRDDSGRYPKFFYPVSEIDSLADVIVANARQKLDTWGEERYKDFMEDNMNKLPDADWQKVTLKSNEGDALVMEKWNYQL
tara:strand:+ start:753 stop:1211 length:459 start_codon:yes stop_codon:yes gene_type:complete